VCRALLARGERRVAVEDPCFGYHRELIANAGLEPVPIPVDAHGIDVDELARHEVAAVLVAPAHSYPSGAVLAPARRVALVEWADDADALIVEDDYDAEYRYDRAAVGAVQGLEPDRVVYAGSTAKTLAPALRLGWLVVPAQLVDQVRAEKLLADRGTGRIEQLAFAEFLARGHLDRHRRRMRLRYAARRSALIHALGRELPEASVRGIAAGLHVTVDLPADDDERAILEEARARRIALASMSDYGVDDGPPTLMLGYGHLPEPAVEPGVRELAEAIRAARERAA
jgi:GntR family transcriptional regulator / MocR family aminotransferase